MLLQTSWYPERYADRDIWRQDIAAMQDMGIQAVRLGEFAWMDMEPEAGVFAWDWLDNAMDMLHAAGLMAILCTPTACPPVWLTQAHPDILPVNASGQRMVHGKRQHRCYESAAYLKACKRISRQLTLRYGRHPALFAWQIDNELGGERQHCYCDTCARAYRDYLRDIYGTVEQLNRRWGTQFWAQTYQGFDQIEPPMDIDMQLRNPHNPSHVQTYWRFQSDAIVRFTRSQAEILRENSDVPVTTNTDTFFYGDTVDVFALFESLDVAAIDIYTDSPQELSFYCDIMRAVKPGRPIWIMEYGVKSPRLSADMQDARLRGAELFGLFKLRAFHAGQEQGQDGLLSLTGHPLPAYGLARQYSLQYNRCPAQMPQYPIGFIFDFASAWSHAVTSRHIGPKRHGYSRHLLHDVYPAAYSLAGGARCVRTAEDTSGLAVLLAADLSVHDERWEAVLRAHLKGGGLLIADTNLFRRNQDNVFLTQPPAFYTQALGLGDYVEPRAADQVAYACSVGLGRVILLSPEAPVDIWTAMASMGLLTRKNEGESICAFMA